MGTEEKQETALEHYTLEGRAIRGREVGANAAVGSGAEGTKGTDGDSETTHHLALG